MGGRTVGHNGLEISASPDYWLRRLTDFPFYFGQHNSKFRIHIKKVAEPTEPWPNNMIPFQVEFNPNSSRNISIDVPNLTRGQSITVKMEEGVYVPSPGQAHLRV